MNRLQVPLAHCSLAALAVASWLLVPACPVRADAPPAEPPPGETQPPACAQPAQPEGCQSMPAAVLHGKQKQPLQGGLEENFLPGCAQSGTAAPLQGGLHDNTLQGGAQGTSLMGGAEGGGWQGTLQGGAAQNPLSAGVGNDPDAADQEIMIDWDRWHNTLLQAIQAGTLAKINVQNDVNFVWDPAKQMMISRYGNGASTWYAFEVLPNRKIINIRLTQRSRFPSYDQAVVQAITDLQGNEILRYPKGSKRKIVTQESNVKTGAETQYQNFQFGDRETQRR